MPQLRWVGREYASSSPRVVVVLENPGTGDYHGAAPSSRMRGYLQGIEPGNTMLQGLMDWMLPDMANWVCRFDPSFTMMTFYTAFADLGLTEDTIAFVNLALCGARRKTDNGTQNVVEPSMLNNCMEHHSMRILQALDPQVVLLGGTKVANRQRRIQRHCPHATFIPVPHYAFRASGLDGAREKLANARNAISRLRTQEARSAFTTPGP